MSSTPQTLVAFVLAIALIKAAYISWDRIPQKCWKTEVVYEHSTPEQVCVLHSTGSYFYINPNSNLLDEVRRSQYNDTNTYRTIKDDTSNYYVPGHLNTIFAEQDGNKIWIGTPDGLRTFQNKRTRIVCSRKENITEIFMAIHISILYAVISTLHGSEYEYDVYRFIDDIAKDGEKLDIKIERPFARNFVADFHGNYYFYKKSSDGKAVLNVMLNGSSSSTEYEMGDKLQALAVDNLGKVYAVESNRLYRLKPDNKTPQFLNTLKYSLTYLSFDEINAIVAADMTFYSKIILIELDAPCMKAEEKAANKPSTYYFCYDC